MQRRLLIAILSLLLLPGAAAAGDEKKPKEAGQYVDLQPVALPIVVDGRLLNYIFVNVRINLKSAADVSKLRTREPFFRDALVRQAHATPFVLATDYQKVDEAKVIASVTRDANAIAGPGNILSVAITQQTSQRRVSTPKAAAPAAPEGAARP